jgi:hypothetical protein
MNTLQYIQYDYIGKYTDSEEKNTVVLSKPEKVKMVIEKNGLLKIKDKRYLRLGKISLYDPVKQQCITDKEYVGILDTDTGEIQCFDIDEIYSQYIEAGVGIMRVANTKYKLTDQTKEIVMNNVHEKRQAIKEADLY